MYQQIHQRQPYSEHFQVRVSELSEDDHQTKQSKILENQKANIFYSVITLIKSVVGVGIIGLPYTFSKLGWILAIIVCGFFAIINQFSCNLLLKIKNLSHRSNYTTIGYKITKSKIFLIMLYLIFLIGNVGSCITQINVFKDIIMRFILLHTDLNSWYLKSWFLTGICLGVVMLPLVLIKKIQNLRHMAAGGVILVSIFFICLIINFFQKMISTNWNLGNGFQAFPRSDQKLSIIASIPNFLFAFCFQLNYFPIFKGLKNSTDAKMKKVSFIGILCCYLLFVLIGFIGYRTYGNDITANFLLSIKHENTNVVLFYILNLSFGLSVIFSFPIIFFAARNCFIGLIKLFNFKQQDLSNKSDYVQLNEILQTNDAENSKKSKIVFYSLSVVLLIITMILAQIINKLQIVLNVIGSISGMAISFSLPSIYYIAYIRKNNRKRTIKYKIAIIIFIISIPFSVLAIVSQFIK